MKLNTLVQEVHQTAIDKGWWDNPRTSLEIYALIHSEISEAVEKYRKDEQGEAEELVDAVIRIMDFFGSKGWDFEKVLRTKMNYNKTRSYRHGNKRA